MPRLFLPWGQPAVNPQSNKLLRGTPVSPLPPPQFLDNIEGARSKANEFCVFGASEAEYSMSLLYYHLQLSGY